MTLIHWIGVPINILLNKLGFNISRIRDETDTKYLAIIKELEGVYKEFLFKDLPINDKRRIHLMGKLEGTEPSEALYLLNYLHKSLKLKGDVCEFGVANGATSALIAYEIKSTDKCIWLFDSFQGLPKPSEKDVLLNDIYRLGSIEAYEGRMACPIDSVHAKLKDIDFSQSRTRIIPGFINDTIKSSILPGKVCFAYVDFDFYEPIRTALNFLDTVISANGFIMVDDYGFFSAGAKYAVDEFLEAKKGNYQTYHPIESAGKFCILKRTEKD
ncbi:MAG: macrocin O-methyltransferase [Methanothrix sp.]|nr:macrocin O-methyltransferase [Methanothrix sp.]